MRIHFEIKEKLPNIIEEILHSDKWITEIKEQITGRTTYALKDASFDSEATAEIYDKEVVVKTAWSKYIYRIYMLGDNLWCEYTGAYRGLLEQKILPSITPKESLLKSEVIDSSLFGKEQVTLREYAEENLKLKNFRRQNFAEAANGTASYDHPKQVYDAFIKEDFIPD